ncbi:MAG: hypothetical protein A3A98_02820 [Candidatus Staskawiczbacteria bacterium RIFCSPLOWO2_01_FULL_40_39]|uniref:Uncharacterized protein n=1 Tax=Candidatus Staskawiczbacteria bacterium RIFCSPHIGHO2_01_FULL_39_25 TaxID=1802202 RepID=A0A1G2HM83_9BACT|nr:MAG: hypothetical protein A2730_03600 [Candidatus Staskawiczbacteria bacterium RIFCSPHIGHO2_01_FULL_39_25]OGZ73680.1 MAG: hypothetical protein A3A98_02820 [Candidatus Staskawiczbacteria bacterium RIFCSPLOWO2_01_FULL_40_39]
MNYIHKELADGRWLKFSFAEQMANTGAEIGRAINWKIKDEKISNLAFERGLELLDLTINDPKNSRKLKELCRLREVLADYFMGNNEYGSTDQSWNNYFYFFNAAVSAKYF